MAACFSRSDTLSFYLLTSYWPSQTWGGLKSAYSAKKLTLPHQFYLILHNNC